MSILLLTVLVFSTSNAQDTTSTINFFNDSLISENSIESKIISSANDSIDYDIENNKVFLYKNAKITYQSIELQAAFIELDSENNIVFAKSLIDDSTGQNYGYPIFSENGKSFTAKEITYNFDTKKGIIKEVRTQEGEGYILGQKVKKSPDDVVYTSKGKYTTCQNDTPHFSIKANRIKTIPNKRIITGPALLEFSGVPTPLAIPFGFFPNQKKQSSGIIFPFYGESTNQGFFLRNGGYYFAINDYIDLTLIGDIYSKGSWNLNLKSSYKKRYKYNGNLSVNYARLKSGNSIIGNNSDQRDFFIKWTHRQDPKASHNSQFSANINAGSRSFQQNNSYNDKDYLSNTFRSGISYSKTFKQSALSINLRHTQNIINKTVDLSLPEINYNINRIYPFKILNKSGINKWYDNIGLKYNSQLKNSIFAGDSILFESSSLSKFKNGFKHQIPISTSFKAFKYFTLSPSFEYTERWYLNKIEKSWLNNNLNTDTIYGFNRVYNYRFNVSANTKIYGTFNFSKGKIKALRHVLSPTISYNYFPDFSNSKYGYYDEVQIDSLGNTQTYTFYQNGIFGFPSNISNSSLSINLGNILEMKVNSKDSIQPIKKIKLLESFNLSTNYNFNSDSLNFAIINLSSRTRLLNKFDLLLSSNYDPYISNSKGQRINSFYFTKNRLPARLINTTLNLNFSLKGGDKSEENQSFHWLDYVDFNVPWNLKVNYIFNYNKISLSEKINHSLNFSGDLKLTDKWKIGFNSGYDFKVKNLSYTSLNIYRDLHCWEMIVKWIPFGYRQSYNFTIRVKASVLQDLKWEKKKDWYDY